MSLKRRIWSHWKTHKKYIASDYNYVEKKKYEYDEEASNKPLKDAQGGA